MSKERARRYSLAPVLRGEGWGEGRGGRRRSHCSAVPKLASLFLIMVCSAQTLALTGAEPSKPPWRLFGAVTIASPHKEPAIQHALRDLASDCEKVLGQPARLVEGSDGAIVVRLDAALSQPESWRIEIDSKRAVITASDTLGAVFGIYGFSERLLGVDPLWYWKDLEPVRRDELFLPAQVLVSQPAAFRYRGWFVNDEDLLTEWKPGSGPRFLDYPFYQQVISLDVADRIFEALLRSGGNLVIPASFVDVMNPPEAELVRRAVARGLYVTQHHIEPLGVSHFAFETYWKQRGEKAAFSYSTDPERVRQTWTVYARKWRELAGDQVLWQLGLRGRGDKPVWASDKGVTAADAGAFVSRALADQWAIVRAVDPRPQPPATATLWLEGSDLMRRGTLKFPPGITIVFADEGRSQMLQDDFRQTPREPGHTYGTYYHLAFWSEGPHLVQGTWPEKLKRNFDALLAKGDTHYAIVNVANVREHVLGLAAAMEIMQQGSAWDEREFLVRWAPPVLDEAYREFLASFVELPGDRLLQDGSCFVLASRHLLPALEKGPARVPAAFFPKGGQEPRALAEALAKSLARLDRVVRDYPSDKIPAGRRAFHDCHLRVQAAMLRHYYGYVRELVLALDDRQHLRSAVAELEELLGVRQSAAAGKWAGWYHGDRKENLPALLERTRALASRRADP
jgi:hypothetical protein